MAGMTLGLGNWRGRERELRIPAWGRGTAGSEDTAAAGGPAPAADAVTAGDPAAGPPTGQAGTGQAGTGQAGTGQAADGPAAPPLPAAAAAATSTGATPAAAPAARSGLGSLSRIKVAGLAAAVLGVLAVAGIVASTLGGQRAAGRTTAAASQRAHPASPAAPLQVVSVTEGGATRHTDGADPVQVTLSAPLAATSPLPVIHPSVPGTWKRSGRTLTFTPATPFQPDTAIRVRFRGGHRGLHSAAGGLLASTAVDHLRTKGWSTLRLKQLLAQLGYLPLKWKAQDATAPQPDNMATELAAVYAPPAGSFTWKGGYPKILTTFWGGPSSLIMDGAIRAFQSNVGLTMTGVMTWDLWQHLLKAAAKGQTNPNGYTYALASKGSPETLTVWHNGHVVMHTLVNTGIPAAPTADGTNPVYLRYRFQIMRGTNPDGSHYADPVSWVSYFSAGEAVHYFPRGSYGFPQSLGCVELPYTQAEQVWPYMTYGTLVTVTG
jgi:lipoprotein-anchoring transpeptidase ErfK/SrfK